jgi:hypothetical protein
VPVSVLDADDDAASFYLDDVVLGHVSIIPFSLGGCVEIL